MKQKRSKCGLLYYLAFWLFCLPLLVLYAGSKVREVMSRMVSRVIYRPEGVDDDWMEDEWMGI